MLEAFLSENIYNCVSVWNIVDYWTPLNLMSRASTRNAWNIQDLPLMINVYTITHEKVVLLLCVIQIEFLESYLVVWVF